MINKNKKYENYTQPRDQYNIYANLYHISQPSFLKLVND